MSNKSTLRNATIRSLSTGANDVTATPDSDLQPLIDEAEGGGTLTLEAGTYQLPPNGIKIGSNIDIIGETDNPDEVLLVGDPEEHNVSETNYLNVKNYPEENITLKNFTLDSGFGYDDRDWVDVGIGVHLAVISADNSVVENCKFLNGTRDCLDISQSKDLVVRECVLEDAHTDDVLEINDTDEATGVPSTNPRSNNILIDSCEIRRAGFGRLLDGDPQSYCRGIEIEGVWEDGLITIKDCIIEESVGVDLGIAPEDGIGAGSVDCLGNDFKTGRDELHEGGSFRNAQTGCVFFDEHNTFKDDDIDNVITGYRDNIRAPNWGIDNCA